MRKYELINLSENVYMCLLFCNELGKGRPRLETGATDDDLLGYLKQQTQSSDGIM